MAAASVLSNPSNGTARAGKELAEKIRGKAAAMNYQPNISILTPAGRSSRTIGVLINSMAPSPRFRIPGGIEKKATRRGYRSMIGEAHDSLENLRHNYNIFMQCALTA